MNTDALPLISTATPIRKYNGYSSPEGRITTCWERIELDDELSRVGLLSVPSLLMYATGQIAVVTCPSLTKRGISKPHILLVPLVRFLWSRFSAHKNCVFARLGRLSTRRRTEHLWHWPAR